MHNEYATARTIIDTLRRHGITVTRVGYDGRDGGGERFNDATTEEIMAAATATDSATFDTSNGEYVWLVWGNGFDVIADYSAGLEEIMEPIEDRLETLERLSY